MFHWLFVNLGTVILTLALIGLVTVVLLVLCRDRKKGKCTCGGNCGHCPMGASCHHDT